MASSRRSKPICRADLCVRTYFPEYSQWNFKTAEVELRVAAGINSHRMRMEAEKSGKNSFNCRKHRFFFLNKHIIQTYFLIKIAQIAISKLPTKWYFAPKFETKVMRDACHPGIPRIVHQGITFNFFNVLNIFAVFLTYFFLWITDDQTLDRRS